MKGFRQQQQGSRKERLKGLEVELKNLSMGSRISQMMTQQILQSNKAVHEDLSRALNLISELQYKILAIQRVAGLDVEAMNKVANDQRLIDFNEASDREDTERSFTVGDKVNEQSVIILTSTTEEKDRGIFRSRLKLTECGVPDLINAFMGREVGAKALVSLNGLDHEVELLAIRQPPPGVPEAGVPEAVVGQTATPAQQTSSVITEAVGNA
jgi:hypothetical protein